MKTLNLRISLVVISVLSLLLLPATTGYAKGTSDNVSKVMVSEKPSLEDANWTIIKTEELAAKDPSTGEEIITTAVTRRGPARCGYKKHNRKNEPDAVALPMTTCVYQTSTTFSNSRGATGVTAYVKVFADNYCGAYSDCAYNKMTKIQAWWKRTSTSYTVRSAYMKWGCAYAFCNLCSTDGGPVTPGTRQSTTFTPAWNGLTTQVYYLTYSSWPIMKSNAYGQVLGFSHGVVNPTGAVLDVFVILPGPY